MKNSCSIYFPRSIVECAGTENAEYLLKKKTLQIGLKESELISVEAGGYVLLDFGRELAGGVRVLVYNASAGAKMRLRLGESVAECCAEPGEKNCCNAHAYRDLTVPVIDLSDSSFFDSGFRFVRVDAVGGSISFKSIVAEALDSEIERKGSFECSDSLLNEIYATAARTVDLCVRRGVLWDGIKRDRLVWIGDIYPELLSLEGIASDLSPVLRSLDFMKEQTPPTEWMCTIPVYSMWWLIILYEYYRRTGDKAYLASQREYLEALLHTIDPYIAEDGNTLFEYNLVDWPTHETEDEAAGVHMIAVIALEAAAKLLKEFGADVSLCKDLLERLHKKSFVIGEHKQIIALKDFAYGSMTEEEKEKLLAGGAKGMSTFMSYFLLRSMDRAAGTKRALEIAKEYYGGMLKMGATTFWEDFDLDWLSAEVCPIDRKPAEGEKDIHGDFGAYCYLGYRHSLCHGWSSGVLPYLVERVLGVSVEDGGKTVFVAPSLGGLEWVKGDVPLKNGVLHVEVADGRTRIKAPCGVKVICRRAEK